MFMVDGRRHHCNDHFPENESVPTRLGPEGEVVIRKIDETATECWWRRSVAEGRSPTTPSDGPSSVASALSGETRAGWDPWEVWLRRIDQPRRRRAEGESSRD